MKQDGEDVVTVCEEQRPEHKCKEERKAQMRYFVIQIRTAENILCMKMFRSYVETRQNH